MKETMVDSVSGPHIPPIAASYRSDSGSIEKFHGRVPAIAVRPWHADAMSIAGALLCIVAGVLLALGAPLYIAAILFPLGGLCDLLDGRIARAARPASSEAGAFIDSICDKLGEVGLLLGLAAFADEQSITFLALAALGFAALTSYTKAMASEHGIAMDWSEARTFGRAGRVLLLSATLLFAAFTSEHDVVFTAGLVFLLGFNCVTFVWRLVRVTHALTAAKRHH